MKITLITTGLAVGGGEKQVCDLADQFIISGHHVQLISLTGTKILSPKNDNIELIELHAKKNIISLTFSLFKAIKLVKKFNPNIMHSHMVHANIFSRFISLFTKVPLVCTAHSTNEGGLIRTLSYRYTDSLCMLNTNVSDEGVDIYIDKNICSKNKIISVVNGVDVDKFKFCNDFRIKKRNEVEVKGNEILFLAVGRLAKEKDYNNLLNAFSLFTKKCLSAKLVIIGVGELESELIKLMEELNLEKNVSFLGYRSDVDEWMSAADIFVMSSEWEGLPLVILEAMACERPIIATDCGGIGKLIKTSGELVPIKDSLQLSNALERMFKMSTEERKELGMLSRDYIINNYSLNAVSDKWISIYKKILK